VTERRLSSAALAIGLLGSLAACSLPRFGASQGALPGYAAPAPATADHYVGGAVPHPLIAERRVREAVRRRARRHLASPARRTEEARIPVEWVSPPSDDPPAGAGD
jgi:hypothetical protein